MAVGGDCCTYLSRRWGCRSDLAWLLAWAPERRAAAPARRRRCRHGALTPTGEGPSGSSTPSPTADHGTHQHAAGTTGALLVGGTQDTAQAGRCDESRGEVFFSVCLGRRGPETPESGVLPITRRLRITRIGVSGLRITRIGVSAATALLSTAVARDPYCSVLGTTVILQYSIQAGVQPQPASSTHTRVYAAMAVALGQAAMPPAGQRLCDMPDAEISATFCKAYPRMAMGCKATGLGLQRWSEYADAAYVGSWAQALHETQREVGSKGWCQRLTSLSGCACWRRWPRRRERPVAARRRAERPEAQLAMSPLGCASTARRRRPGCASANQYTTS
eukprot:COSAG01_NODE_752_length_13837_cov_76.381670_7_plen_334_part_00